MLVQQTRSTGEHSREDGDLQVHIVLSPPLSADPMSNLVAVPLVYALAGGAHLKINDSILCAHLAFDRE